MTIASDHMMSAFEPYVNEIETLVERALVTGARPDLSGSLEGILDGQPSNALRSLALTAIARGASADSSKPATLDSLFPHIQVADGLTAIAEIKSADLIVLNPPFVRVHAPADWRFSTGLTSMAAIFVERCIRHAV